ncbi:MAG: (2Fe-2S)-binding protein [Gammaproteobacteria bacterium]|nr:(2Fe-2S)-binding protein [Gammaproteobacteria bacterium]
MTEQLTLTVNGQRHQLEVDPQTPLLLVLRNTLGLTAAKLGCGLEQCGACAVLVDGVATLSCVAPAGQFEGKTITTLEGIHSLTVSGSRLQDAFVENAAAQCGYCTGGILIALTALFDRQPRPDETQIREALADHLCRCGSHARVLAAARATAGHTEHRA